MVVELGGAASVVVVGGAVVLVVGGEAVVVAGARVVVVSSAEESLSPLLQAATIKAATRQTDMNLVGKRTVNDLHRIYYDLLILTEESDLISAILKL